MTTVEVTSHPALLAEAAELRRAVFVDEQGVDPALEFDGRDEEAVHVVCASHGRVTGTARMFDTGSEAVIGRVAVAASERGHGLGRLVMDCAERWASRQGLTVAELHAQVAVAGFYQRLGYAATGEPYQEAGIPHQTMRKELIPGLRPVRDEDGPALEALLGRIWAAYPGVILDVDGEEPWLRAPASAYAGPASETGELWVVDEPGAGIIASAGWRPGPGPRQPGELKTLYVAPEQRRQGIASRLVHFVERRAGGRNRLRVWSDSRFVESHAMYERLGYRRTGATRELHDRSATVEVEFAGAPTSGP